MWSAYMTILILVFISGVYTETCPEEEDISPCQCQEKSGYIMVWCSFFKIKQDLETLQQALNSLSGKHNVHLHLEYFNSSISSNSFSGIGIKKLNFHACRMDSLTKDDQPGLLGLENHLEYLRISESSSALTKLNLGHLKNLKTIDLSGNNIKQLGDDWLSNDPPFLESLTIWESNIIKIGSNAFSHLNSLKTLSLADNRFGPIKRSMFPTRADRLKTLGIINNALTDLPVDIFSSMPAIENIHLSRNGITTLDERTWSPVWKQLKRVDLYDNKIFCDERLNWIQKSKKRPKVAGLCSGPEEFEMVSLEDFFKNPKPGKLF